MSAHSPGLTFRKLDLHLHTPASSDCPDKSVTSEAIVLRAKEAGLAGFAVTDHNSGTLIDDIKEAGDKHGVVVFPGVEISCSGGTGGIHIIAILDVTCKRVHIESLLSELGFRPEQYGDINAVVQKNPMEVVQVIHDRGGLAVLAHANSTSGALGDMKGQQRTEFIKYPYVSAAEATDCQHAEKKQTHKRVIDLLDGNDPTFKRKLAVYQASDSHETKIIGTRCSYFKLDQINLDGLRQCFADPDVRIRQDFEYSSQHFPQITRVQVTGGFLDGADAGFHEGLNSILGGKGVGKSLLVEFLRFGLDQPPSNEEIRKDHDSKLHRRLEDYGTIQVTISDETGKTIALKRTYDPAEENPYSEDSRDDVAQLFPVLFLSQNEIIRIAEEPDEQIAFIDRFFDFRSYQSEIAGLERQLEALDRDLAECLRATRELKIHEKQLKTKETDLAKLDKALKNPIFDEYAKQETKDRVLREQLAWVKSAATRLTGAKVNLQGPAQPAIPEQLQDDPAARRVHNWGTEARTQIGRFVDSAVEAMEKLVRQVQEEYDKWEPGFKEVKRGYESAIQKEGGDYKALAQQRTRTVKELETLRVRVAAKQDSAGRTKEIGDNRKAVLASFRNTYENYSKERKNRCAKIEDGSERRLKITIHEASNLDEFRDRLGELKRGSHLSNADIEKICSHVDPGDFMRAVITYSLSLNPAHLDTIAKRAGIDPGNMVTLAAFLAEEYDYEKLLSLEYKAMPQDRPDIQFDIGSGDFQPLDELSVGQKCTAMLIIALTAGSMPIVIDQPEDSLDLRTIWEDICSKVRDGKEKRQFIFTTHSSSVAVASDTDKFLILDGDATRGRVVFSGSMDHDPVSSAALKYLEGGPQTYLTKYRKYRGDDIIR